MVLTGIDSYHGQDQGSAFPGRKGTLYHAFLRKASDKVVLLDEADSFDVEEDIFDPKFVSKDFFSYWTVHGPSRIIGNRYWIGRIIWLIVWLSAVIYCIMQCYNVFILYLTYPKLVTVDLVDTDNLTFPAVTFCSLNPFVINQNALLESDLWVYFQQIENENEKAKCDGLTSGLGYYDSFFEQPQCFKEDCHNLREPAFPTYEYPTEEPPPPPPPSEGYYPPPPSEGYNPPPPPEGYYPPPPPNLGDLSDPSLTSSNQEGDSSGFPQPLPAEDTSEDNFFNVGLLFDDPNNSDPKTENDPLSEGPVNIESTNEDPINNDPLTGDTINNDPIVGDTLNNAPMTGDTLNNDPMTGDTLNNDPINKDSTKNDPIYENQVDNDPINENPDMYDPPNENPISNDPASNDPLNNDPLNTDTINNDPLNVKLLDGMNENPVDNNQLNEETFNTDPLSQDSVNNDPLSEAIEYSDIPPPLINGGPMGGARRRKRETEVVTEINYEDFHDNDIADAAESTSEKRHLTRLACSRTYQRLYFEKNPTELENSIYKHIGIKNCMSDIKEEFGYNPICSAPFIRDVFGTYNTLLIECNSGQMKGKKQICSNCCSSVYECMDITEYEELKLDNLSVDKLLAVIKNSRTKDGIDLFGRFVEKSSDVDKVALEVDQFLLTCSFDGNPCSYRDFKIWMSDKYGYCYTFNAANFNKKNAAGTDTYPVPVRVTHNVGPQNGLRVTTDLHEKSTMSFLSPEIGLKVIVHDPKVLPFPEEEGITVLPGVISSVKVSQHRILRQQPPVGKCEKHEPTGYFEYTTTLCRKLCIDYQYRKRCNCTTGKSPGYYSLVTDEDYKPCSLFNTATLFCMDSVLFDYKTNLQCKCPPRCEEWEYRTTVTTSKTNKRYYTILQNIKGTKIGDDICTGEDSSTARVHVYVDRNGYEEIKEIPAYSWETLLSNIGGTFGLFVGMSVVSVLEFVEYMLGMTMIFSRGNKDKIPKRIKKRTHVPLYLMIESNTENQKPVMQYKFTNENAII